MHYCYCYKTQDCSSALIVSKVHTTTSSASSDDLYELRSFLPLFLACHESVGTTSDCIGLHLGRIFLRHFRPATGFTLTSGTRNHVTPTCTIASVLHDAFLSQLATTKIFLCESTAVQVLAVAVDTFGDDTEFSR